MCGIFAYLNYYTPRTRFRICEIILDGLKKLEYRGYDSAGIAVDGIRSSDQDFDPKMEIYKSVGPVKNLETLIFERLSNADQKLLCHVGLGHTRWATHGKVEEINCHPVPSSDNHEFAVIHNGIVTNYPEIRLMLEKDGIKFNTETDTEIISTLFLYFYRQDLLRLPGKPTFSCIATRVVSLIEGASAIVVKSKFFPNELCAFKRGSPLLFGVKSKGDLGQQRCVYVSQENNIFAASPPELCQAEYFLASDATVITEYTCRIFYLEDNDLVHFSSNASYRFFNVGQPSLHLYCQKRKESLIYQIPLLHSKGDFEHYMLKEIYEQTESVFNAMRGRVNFTTGDITLGGLNVLVDSLSRCRHLLLIACGSSYNSCLAVRPLFEILTSLSVSIENSSDFIDRSPSISQQDICFFVSQSGETYDTIKALKYCKSRRALCVGVTNTVGSVVSRLTDCGVYLNAGPEFGVASTKCYTSQIIVLSLIALKISQQCPEYQQRRLEIVQFLRTLPETLEKTFLIKDKILELANEYKNIKSMLVLGRGYQLATSFEGALKIKELAYIHSEGCNSAELKHGPLALVDPLTPIVMIVTKDNLYEKSLSCLRQILCRNGNPIVICTQGDETIKSLIKTVIEVPYVIDCLQSVVNVVPFQLFSYFLAKFNGINVDRPRNLAKAVTVE